MRNSSASPAAFAELFLVDFQQTPDGQQFCAWSSVPPRSSLYRQYSSAHRHRSYSSTQIASTVDCLCTESHTSGQPTSASCGYADNRLRRERLRRRNLHGFREIRLLRAQEHQPAYSIVVTKAQDIFSVARVNYRLVKRSFLEGNL